MYLTDPSIPYLVGMYKELMQVLTVHILLIQVLILLHVNMRAFGASAPLVCDTTWTDPGL